MSIEDIKATLHGVADETELQVGVLRSASLTLGSLLVELGELLVGSHRTSLANEGYTNVEIAVRCLESAAESADRSADITRAQANVL